MQVVVKYEFFKFSDCDDKDFFLNHFKNAQGVRASQYQVGVLAPEIWQNFVLMLTSFDKEFWIVLQDGKFVARIGANVSQVYPEVGYFGFFEIDTGHSDYLEIGKQLLVQAESWLKSKGVEKVIGPVNFNTWFPYRFRINEDESRRFSWEPVNPPQYVKVIEAAGYELIEDYHTMGLEGVESYAQSTVQAYSEALSRGFSFREIDSSRLMEREVDIIYHLSMAGFEKSFLFERIPIEAFRLLYVPIANKVDLSLSHFVLDSHGEEVGFFFVFQDQDYMVLKSVAIHPKARGHNLSNALTYLSAQKALGRGLNKMITALVRHGAQSESYAKKAHLLWKHEYGLWGRNNV